MASSPRRRHARDDFVETIRIVEDVEIFLHTGQGYRKTKLKMAEQTLRASDERWVFTNKAIPLRNRIPKRAFNTNSADGFKEALDPYWEMHSQG